MRAAEYNFVMEQGADFRKRVRWRVNGVLQDLTNFTAAMQIRPNVDSPEVLATLSTQNGRILNGGVEGYLDLIFPSTLTKGQFWTQGSYDLFVYGPFGTPTRKLLKGTITLDRQVTRV